MMMSVHSRVKTLFRVLVGVEEGNDFGRHVHQWSHRSWELHFVVLVCESPGKPHVLGSVDGGALSVIPSMWHRLGASLL
jgi:hypothetical protein